MKLLIASNNKHKIDEIRKVLKEKITVQVEVFSPKDLGIDIDVIEDADTLEGNALLKAEAFYKASEIPVIADDTGLLIEFLEGKPGVYSARYAGEPPVDRNNRKKVLAELEGISKEKRNAKFVTVICYIDKTGHYFIIGECEGTITIEEKGDNGFGYDSIFSPAGFDRTFAEMSSSEKNAISHRGKAIVKFAEWLSDFIN